MTRSQFIGEIAIITMKHLQGFCTRGTDYTEGMMRDAGHLYDAMFPPKKNPKGDGRAKK